MGGEGAGREQRGVTRSGTPWSKAYGEGSQEGKRAQPEWSLRVSFTYLFALFIYIHIPPLSFPSPIQPSSLKILITTNLFTISRVFPFSECHGNAVTQEVVFSKCAFTFSNMPLKLVKSISLWLSHCICLMTKGFECLFMHIIGHTELLWRNIYSHHLPIFN